MSSADFFFKINIFERFLSEIPSGSQKIWIQIRPNILSGLIWVQTVFRGYQRQRVNCNIAVELDWLQSLKQFFINVSYHILVASLTLMALF